MGGSAKSSGGIGGGGGIGGLASAAASSSSRRGGGGAAPKFVVPVPAVPREIVAAVRERSHSKERARIVQLHRKLAEQRERAVAVQDSIRELEASKLDARRRAEDELDRDTAAALQEIESEVVSRYEADKAKRREAWQQKVEEEFQRELDGDQAVQRKKRTREEAGTVDDDGDSSDSGQKNPKPSDSASERDPGSTRQPTSSDESSPPLLPPSDALMAAQVDEEAAASYLKAQKELQQDAQRKLDKLQEKRGEIVWLLKQVIKAEEKAKAKTQQIKTGG
jgi:hypothetical protein